MKKSKKNIIKNFENPDNEREYLLSKIKLHQKEKESRVKDDFLDRFKTIENNIKNYIENE